MVGWSNLILDPTLALIRAQLGFRIQVRAGCGNISEVSSYREQLQFLGLCRGPLEKNLYSDWSTVTIKDVLGPIGFENRLA